MIIHTWLRWGQLLKPDILRGIVDNNCDLMVISSKAIDEGLKYDEENIYNNRKEAFARFTGDIFLGMDSDVVLWPGVIQQLLALTEQHDAVIWPDKHNLFGIRKNIMDKYEFDLPDKNKCSLCQYFDKLKLNNVDVYRSTLKPVSD